MASGTAAAANVQCSHSHGAEGHPSPEIREQTNTSVYTELFRQVKMRAGKRHLPHSGFKHLTALIYKGLHDCFCFIKVGTANLEQGEGDLMTWADILSLGRVQLPLAQLTVRISSHRAFGIFIT